MFGTDASGKRRIAHASPARLPSALDTSRTPATRSITRTRERRLTVKLSPGGTMSLVCSISNTISDQELINALTAGPSAVNAWSHAVLTLDTWRRVYADSFPRAQGEAAAIRDEYLGLQSEQSKQNGSVHLSPTTASMSLGVRPGGPSFTYELPTVTVTATAPEPTEPGYYDLLMSNGGGGGFGIQVVDRIAYSQPDDPFLDPNHECTQDVSRYAPVDLGQTSEVVCPKDHPNICLDLFIPDSVAGGILLGDGRQSDPNAAPTASRAQIVLYQDIKRTAVFVSKSCLRMALPLLGQCSPALAVSSDVNAQNHVTVVYYDDGRIALDVQLRNSKTTIFPHFYPIGPAINVAMTLTPNGQGGFSTSGVRDSYPSLDVWQWKDGAHTALIQLNATNPFALIDAFGQTQLWCVP